MRFKWAAGSRAHRQSLDSCRLGALVGAVFLSSLAGGGYLPVTAALAGYAALSPDRAIRVLSVSWIMTLINPALARTPDPGLRWVILAGAAIGVARSLGTFRLGVPVAAMLAMLFAGFAAVTGSIGANPLLSVLKAVAFLVPVVVLIRGFGASHFSKAYWGDWLAGMAGAVIWLSVPLVFVPSVGYQLNGSGFQGILNHPQALGVFLAVASAFLTVRSVNVRAARGIAALSTAVLTWVLLYLSESRTGMVAALAGIAVAGMISLRRGSARGGGMRRKAPIAFLIGLGGLVLVFTLSSLARSMVSGFVIKGSSGGGVVSIVEESRGSLIESSLANFRDHPLIGIGLGSRSDMGRDASDESTFLGLPLSGAAEKGFLGSALLEEVGIVGFVLFGALLVSVVVPAVGSAPLATCAAGIVGLTTNLAETSIVSLGGFGLFLWWVLAMAYPAGGGRRARQGRPALGPRIPRYQRWRRVG